MEQELELTAAKEYEFSKLKVVSKQFKDRLDNLKPKEKKMLCNIFIKRIDLNRTELPTKMKRKEWNITLDIYLRFNPTQLEEQFNEGRTSKSLNGEKRLFSMSENLNFGGICWTKS